MRVHFDPRYSKLYITFIRDFLVHERMLLHSPSRGLRMEYQKYCTLLNLFIYIFRKCKNALTTTIIVLNL